MSIYYVDINANSNGDHEIHLLGCSLMPVHTQRVYLGNFENCFDALDFAIKYFTKSSACNYCLKECHMT